VRRLAVMLPSRAGGQGRRAGPRQDPPGDRLPASGAGARAAAAAAPSWHTC